LGAARRKVQEDKEVKEKEDSIENLEFCQSNTPEIGLATMNFVPQKLKWLVLSCSCRDPKGGNSQ
jgi:hypothetical protein